MLLCLIALTASTNVLHGSDQPNNSIKKTSKIVVSSMPIGLDTMLQGVTVGCLVASLPVAAFIPTSKCFSYFISSGLIGGGLGGLVAGASTYLPVPTQSPFLDLVKRDGGLDDEQTKAIKNAYILKRGTSASGLIGLLAAIVTVSCYYMGYTAEDIRSSLGL